jgi:hypothetical protein
MATGLLAQELASPIGPLASNFWISLAGVPPPLVFAEIRKLVCCLGADWVCYEFFYNEK